MNGRGGKIDVASGEAVSRLRVSHEGRVAATATVVCSSTPHGTARVYLQSQREVVAPNARSELVDQVLDESEVRKSDHVHVVVALGDAESISRLQERTTNFHARAAGSSSVIDADLVPLAG